MSYGFCPVCSAPGVKRERSLDGNDTCANGHVYPNWHSVHSLKNPDGKPTRDPKQMWKLLQKVVDNLYIDEYGDRALSNDQHELLSEIEVYVEKHK